MNPSQDSFTTVARAQGQMEPGFAVEYREFARPLGFGVGRLDPFLVVMDPFTVAVFCGVNGAGYRCQSENIVYYS